MLKTVSAMALAGLFGALAAPATAPAALAATAPAAARTFVVTPTGTGMQNLEYVVEHVAQPYDVVLLADGTYRVGDIDVTTPKLTIRAQHMPSATDRAPHVWLDGSIPYRWWTPTRDNLWTHSYNRNFCATNLRKLPCNQLSVSYHGDQMFQGGQPIAQTIHVSDLSDTTKKWFYVTPANDKVITNFDPGATIEMSDRETALMFERSADLSSLQGIGVRRYVGNDTNPNALASRQNSAVYVHDATAVAFRNDWFSFNSVRALKTHGDVPASQTPVAGERLLIDETVFDHNGELGLDAVDSDGMQIQRSLFYKNNYENFQIENAGAKLLSVHNAVVVGNQFVENRGIGLWFDRSAYGALIRQNAFVANEWHGAMFEISAKATITENQFVNNGHVGMLVYDSSWLSFSHNLVKGNLYGIKVQDGQRTLRTFPSGRDPDKDRKMPPAITFDVSAIDVHANGFYYAPATPSGAVCDPNPNAIPTATVPDPFAGCQYMMAGSSSRGGGQPNDLGIKAVNDNFHTRDWPTSFGPGVLPTFVALWKTSASVFGASGCSLPPGDVYRYRWASVPEFQCTGQEFGARLMY